jgi:hypothetical protein
MTNDEAELIHDAKTNHHQALCGWVGIATGRSVERSEVRCNRELGSAIIRASLFIRHSSFELGHFNHA